MRERAQGHGGEFDVLTRIIDSAYGALQLVYHNLIPVSQHICIGTHVPRLCLKFGAVEAEQAPEKTANVVMLNVT